MIRRKSDIRIIKHKLSKNPAIVILGPRQVGKTTLVQNMDLDGIRYLDLESENDNTV